MKIKNVLFFWLTSSIISTLICLLYDKIYSDAFQINFSQVLNAIGITISCLIGNFLMVFGYFLLFKFNLQKLQVVANILYAAISFGSIVGVLAFKMPLEIEFPEMFPGLAIPMHFFPIMTFLSLAPLFIKNSTK